MESLDVPQEYAELLAQSRRAGATREVLPDLERRVWPRFSVQTDDLWINSVGEFAVQDMSAGGIAFATNYPLQPGARIDVSLNGEHTTTAEVISCELVDSATQYYAAEFRIVCRFVEASCGMELLVRTKRREARRSTEAPPVSN